MRALRFGLPVALSATVALGAYATYPGNDALALASALGDQRFVERNSGHYWQISGEGQDDFASRSLWDRRLKVSGRKGWAEPLYYNSDQFPNEPLRVVERTVRLPGSDVEWQFVVARSRGELD